MNRRGQPFREPGQTKAHIDGAHDETHGGERGEDHMDAIHERSVEREPEELPEPPEGASEPPEGASEPPVEASLPEVGSELTERLDIPAQPLDEMVEMHGMFIDGNMEDVGDLESELGELVERVEKLERQTEELHDFSVEVWGVLQSAGVVNPEAEVMWGQFENPPLGGFSFEGME